MTQPCPACEHKKNLLSLNYTPELIEEMAASEPCPDFIGQEQYELRKEICFSCPKLIGGMTCSVCGCFIQFRARHLTAHCADGKW